MKPLASTRVMFLILASINMNGAGEKLVKRFLLRCEGLQRNQYVGEADISIIYFQLRAFCDDRIQRVAEFVVSPLRVKRRNGRRISSS